MNRIEFTKRLNKLLTKMIDEQEPVIIDYIKRSNTEQNLLYKMNKSKCDGYKKISNHQLGKAADLYFIKNNKLDFDFNKYKFWHQIWQRLGGKKMLPDDIPHFEV